MALSIGAFFPRPCEGILNVFVFCVAAPPSIVPFFDWIENSLAVLLKNPVFLRTWAPISFKKPF